MQEDRRYPEQSEREINLVDLCFYLLKHWKTLAVVAVLAALLGFGLYAIRQDKPKTEAVPATDLAAGYAGMTMQDVADMRAAAVLREKYAQQLEYNENNLIATLDPDAYYEGALRYAVSTAGDIRVLTTLCQTVFNDEALIGQIKDILGVDCEERYVRELLGCSVSIDTTDNVYVNNLLGAAAQESATVKRGAIVTYTVMWSQEDAARQVLTVIDEAVSALARENAAAFEGAVTALFHRDVRKADSTTLRTRQISAQEALTTCLNNVAKAESAFSEQKMAYYETAYLQAGLGGDPLAWMESIPEKQSGPLKTIVLAAMAGCVAWGAFFLIRYLRDGRVKYAGELREVYGLSLLGRYAQAERRPRGIDALRERAMNVGAPCLSTQEYIAAQLNLLDEKSLLLCADGALSGAAALRDALCAQCPKAEAANLLQNDEAALKNAKGKDGVVLLAQTGATTHAQIVRELELCRLQRLYMVGVIVLEAR